MYLYLTNLLYLYVFVFEMMEHGFLQQYSYDLWSLSELAWNGMITEAQLYLGVNSRIACVALTLCENLHHHPPVHTCTAVFTLSTTAAFLHDLPIFLTRWAKYMRDLVCHALGLQIIEKCLPGIGSSDWETRARPQMIRQSTDSWLPSSWKSLWGHIFIRTLVLAQKSLHIQNLSLILS